MTDPKSPPAADRTWEPAVGEMCEGNGAGTGDLYTGKFVAWRDVDGAGDSNDCAELNHGGYKRFVKRHTLRPASPSLPEAQFYGVQPAELPETLPAGIRHGHGAHQTHDLVRLERTLSGRPAYACEDGMYCCWVHADEINWTKVPRQATHPPAPELPITWNDLVGKEPSRPAEAKVDPYTQCQETPDESEGLAEATAGRNATRRTERLAALTASPDPLDRLAASRSKRSAHVESHRLGLDVPARVRRAAIGQSAPCVMVRTVPKVEWIDSRKPPWECDE